MTLSNRIVIFLSIILVSLVATKLIVSEKVVLPLFFIGFIVFVFMSFRNIEHGLIILVFSMLLSPEIKLAQLPGREVVIRFDDLILITLFLVWLTHMALKKELGLFTTTPINLPIFIYTLICILFTARAIALGYVNPVKSFFYVLKYIEYFFLFLMTSNIVEEERQVKHLLIAALVTFIIVCIYGYILIGKVSRIWAPFDYDPVRGTGESGSLGGYLLIVMSVLFGLFCYVPSTKLALGFIVLVVFAFVPFAYTLSRASFFAFVPMVLTILLLTEKRKLILFGLIFIGLIFAPVIFPKPTQDVLNRIQETFVGSTEKEENIFGISIKETSAILRIESWKKALFKWLPEQPFFGYGITGVGLVDTQYPLVIGELGLTGFLVFLWLIYSVGKNSLKVFHSMPIDNWLAKGLSLGLFCSLIALLFQSVAVNTFIIIRIMEPFWFLTALVMTLPDIYKEKIS
ncbi:MAG: O-antigen ligase family protein [Endomicrobiia bacterium]